MGICGPAALTDLDNPIAGYRVILVPRADMSLPRNHDIGGIANPSALTPWITIVQIRLPG